jgi:hypothetical protein
MEIIPASCSNWNKIQHTYRHPKFTIGCTRTTTCITKNTKNNCRFIMRKSLVLRTGIMFVSRLGERFLCYGVKIDSVVHSVPSSAGTGDPLTWIEAPGAWIWTFTFITRENLALCFQYAFMDCISGIWESLVLRRREVKNAIYSRAKSIIYLRHSIGWFGSSLGKFPHHHSQSSNKSLRSTRQIHIARTLHDILA